MISIFLNVCASILNKDLKIYCFLLLNKGIIIDIIGLFLNSKSFLLEYLFINEL